MEPDPLADLLLQITSATAQLHVLLSEASPTERKLAQPRLDAFLGLVCDLPKRGRRPRPLGFRP